MSAVQLGVSKYDQVSGIIIALLIMVGCAVLLMFAIWLTMVIVFRPAAVAVTLVEEVAGRGENAEGFERDMEAPGMEEMPELAEPQLETQLEAVTSAVTNVAAAMDVIDTPSTATSKGEGGMGDSRPAGPEGEGENIIPRWERWEIKWESSSRAGYARQLDFFKIELGAFGGGSNIVDYASNLSGAARKRSAPHKEENRLYFSWKGGTLQQFDKQLLSAAGINVGAGRSIMQFFPPEAENTLAVIEMQNASDQGRADVKQFLKTVFGVRGSGRSFEFYIVEQKFRPPPR